MQTSHNHSEQGFIRASSRLQCSLQLSLFIMLINVNTCSFIQVCAILQGHLPLPFSHLLDLLLQLLHVSHTKAQKAAKEQLFVVIFIESTSKSSEHGAAESEASQLSSRLSLPPNARSLSWVEECELAILNYTGREKTRAGDTIGNKASTWKHRLVVCASDLRSPCRRHQAYNNPPGADLDARGGGGECKAVQTCSEAYLA